MEGKLTQCLSIIVMVGACSAADIMGMNLTLRTKFSQNRHHMVNPTYKAAALQYIIDYMKDTLKLDVYTQEFTTLNENANGTNVIGILKGEKFGTEDDVIYGIGTHYDTVRTTAGVDDNGSGMTIMLDVAKGIARWGERKYTLMFVAFDFEESDSEEGAACRNILCGSGKFVNEWMPNFMANIHGGQPTFGGFYIMDTIMNFNDTDNSQQLPFGFNQVFGDEYQSISSDGFDGDFVTVIGRNDDEKLVRNFTSFWSNSTFKWAEWEDVILPITGIPSEFDKRIYGDFFRSDHANFWAANMSAVFLTDTANFRGYMTNCYHQECDNAYHITDENLLFMVKTSNALRDALMELSPRSGPTGGASNIKSAVVTWLILGACMIVKSLIDVHR